jgi:hypothetical protein
MINLNLRLPISCVALLLAAVSGCGGSGGFADGVKTGTVSGKVTFNGAPISQEGATISFLPEGGTGIPAIGGIGSDGSYKLRARSTFDVPTGIYKITVTPSAGPAMSAEEAMEASMNGTLPDSDPKDVPAKYRAAETSGELFEVKEGANTYDLDMKP